MFVRRTLTGIVAALLAAGIATPPAAAAQEDPTGDAYPVTSLLGMLLGPAADGTDSTVGRYALEAGLLGVVPRAVANNPELTDPQQLADPEAARRFGQRALDNTVHSRPTLLGSNILIAGNPYFLPDWNDNGVFGEAGDYDLDNSPKPDTGAFRYPCIGMDWRITYETVNGKCVAGDTEGARFRLGQVRKLAGVVNSRGMRMATKLWLPDTALRRGAGKHPGVVFADGNLSRQSDYYVYHQRLARAGYLVMSFDQAGQGDSEGTAADLFHAPEVRGCTGVPGSCRDVQDAVRWFTGGSITPVVDLENEQNNVQAGLPRLATRRNPAYAPAGENRPNPVLRLLDRSRVGLTGQSMGSISTMSYLHHLPSGKGADGRPLPKIKAAVAISGFVTGSPPMVPTQIQTSDYDLPGMRDIGQGALDGPAGAKAWYDDTRAARRGAGALSMIIIEGGVHEAQSNVTFVPRSPWTAALSTGYQVSWFDCHIKGSDAACARTRKAQPHLSRATASEYDWDGPAGPARSYCITVPDSATVSDPNSLGTLAGQQVHNCIER